MLQAAAEPAVPHPACWVHVVVESTPKGAFLTNVSEDLCMHSFQNKFLHQNKHLIPRPTTSLKDGSAPETHTHTHMPGQKDGKQEGSLGDHVMSGAQVLTESDRCDGWVLAAPAVVSVSSSAE